VTTVVRFCNHGFHGWHG